jgi:hypothetical protein
MAESDLANAAVEVTLVGPEPRGSGFYGYDRYRVLIDGVEVQRDALRVGRVVVIVPVDLARDEIVLIRQFRLGAHLSLGLGDVVEVPAGRVERDEDVTAAALRECQEEIGVFFARGAGADLRPDAVGGLVGRAHVFLPRNGRCIEGAGARRRRPRAGGHPAVVRVDRSGAGGSVEGRPALRRGDRQPAMAGAQSRAACRDRARRR